MLAIESGSDSNLSIGRWLLTGNPSPLLPMWFVCGPWNELKFKEFLFKSKIQLNRFGKQRIKGLSARSGLSTACPMDSVHYAIENWNFVFEFIAGLLSDFSHYFQPATIGVLSCYYGSSCIPHTDSAIQGDAFWQTAFCCVLPNQIFVLSISTSIDFHWSGAYFIGKVGREFGRESDYSPNLAKSWFKSGLLACQWSDFFDSTGQCMLSVH